MKCQNCGENEANFRYTQIINGVKKQMSLCDECAKKLGLDDINFSMPISFSSFLGDIFNLNDDDFIPSITNTRTLTCNKCNMTYDEFLSTGELGCDNCYDVFKQKIDPLLKNIHGANRHIGRNGNFRDGSKNFQNVDNYEEKDKNKLNKNNIEAEKGQKTKLEELQERLKREIEEERYEDAAKTRDEIKKMK